MNKTITWISALLLAAVMLLTACGEDRTGEYIAKTEQTHWIEAQMSENYLWYSDIPSLSETDYFSKADVFFPKLLSSKDRFSYIEMLDTTSTRTPHILANSTYGFEYILTTDPTGTTSRIFARVGLVLPGSPAKQAGLKRGDWIILADGNNLSTSNSTLLEQGAGVTLALDSLVYDQEQTKWAWKADTTYLDVPASVYMENNPIFLTTVYTTESGKKVGYMVYNEFKTGPTPNDPSDTTFMADMQKQFAALKNEGVTHFVLDLRYNNGGYVQVAQELASVLAPASALGGEFAHLEFNDKQQSRNYAIDLSTQYSSSNLNLSDLYVLTGDYTASSSELIINGLRPYMNVYIVGVQTVGKNVAASQINSPYHFIIFPITATVYNKNNESDYANGFTPDYAIDEDQYAVWYELGNPQEVLLKNALSLIETGVAPDVDTSTSSVSARTGTCKRSPKLHIRVKERYRSWGKKQRPAILTEP